jgi:hypothetical protein
MSSFHGDTVTTTANKLIEACYTYSDFNGCQDKVNFDFTFKTPEGMHFYVYDWKEYRTIDLDESIEFHIGANSSSESREGLEYIYELIN